ncbi:unnamed protein product, partial [Meganyctiphanes norvegica]
MFTTSKHNITRGILYVGEENKFSSIIYRWIKTLYDQNTHKSVWLDKVKITLYGIEMPNLFNDISNVTKSCFKNNIKVCLSYRVMTVVKKQQNYVLKLPKQKIYIVSLSMILKSIFPDFKRNYVAGEDDTEDNGAECVICMCDLRDTLILPCRHLCLCNCCADSLRYQANNCPICRAPFRALLQIKALQKASNPGSNPQPNTEGGDNIPSGYEAVSLIEALNGPSVAPPQQPTAPPLHEMYVQLPQNAADAPSDDQITNEASSGFI